MLHFTVEQALQAAHRHHQSGQLPEAETLYRDILLQSPNHPDALHLLGVLALQTGRNQMAAELIGRALAVRPQDPRALNHLGVALRALGRLDEAVAACRGALALQPGFSGAAGNLGLALKDKGQMEEAIAAARQAIAGDPAYAEGYNNLGNILQADRQWDEAITAYRQTIALKPGYAAVYNNLGSALRAKGLLDEAVAAAQQAIALNPGFAEAYSNLGMTLQALGRFDEAIAACRQAIARRPDFAEGYRCLGNAQRAHGQLDEAVAAFRQAIALQPRVAETCGDMALALKDQGKLQEAIAAWRHALSLSTEKAEIHSNLIHALHFDPANDPESLAKEHRRWSGQHAAGLAKGIRPHAHSRDPDRRLRIGYVSPDLWYHPVGRFLLPLLARHERASFEIVAYAQVMAPDAMTGRLRLHTEGWRNIVGQTDAQVADLIRQDQIDILVDLTMHTARNRLLVFARKPAPIQVSYLAYCSSTGLETMDYRLSDPYLDPPGADDGFYSEQTVRLPESYYCFQPALPDPGLTPPPALANGFVTFGCLNNFCKISEPALAAWIELLRSVPSSRLLLHAHDGSHRASVRERLAAAGIGPERLEFAGFLNSLQYMQLYQRIDIALDTFPYGGATTTCDALWMGIPVVSLAGNTAVGRAGLSILSNAGLPELVARSTAEYVQIAGRLAHDLPSLALLRSRLRPRLEQSPLMNAARFTQNVEAAYRQMWRHGCTKGY